MRAAPTIASSQSASEAIMNPACVNTWGSRRWRTLVVTCATTLVLAVAAVAAPSPPPLPGPLLPLAATPGGPEGAIEARDGDTISFRWSHVDVSLPVVHPRPRHFLICLYKSGVNTCLTTPSKWWVSELTQRRGELWRDIPRRVVGYRYYFQPSDRLTSDQIDRRMHWAIGSCTTTQVSSCEFTPKPVTVWFSTKNLRADISNFSVPLRLDVTGDVENRGSTDSGTFTSELIALPAIVDADDPNLVCEQNVNAPGLTDGDVAVTGSGEELLLGALAKLPNGDRTTEGKGVAAIYRSGAVRSSASNAFSAIPPGAEASAVYLDEENTSTPAVWVTIFKVDTTNAVVEFDETDNVFVECQPIY
jgi:hypothetical protein